MKLFRLYRQAAAHRRRRGHGATWHRGGGVIRHLWRNEMLKKIGAVNVGENQWRNGVISIM